MKLKSLKQARLAGKRVLVRVEYNVPLKNGKITDDSRIKASIPTLQYILSKKPKQLILMTHLGRPKGKDPALSTNVIVKRVSSLLKRKVIHANNVEHPVLSSAEIIFLENLRFYDEEKKGNVAFSKKIAELGEVYVNESFGTCHRKDASMYVVPKYIKERYAGFLLEKEIEKLSEALAPKKPFYVLVGFAKIGDKIKILEKLLKKADKIILGGAIVFNFLRAKGFETGKSLIDENSITLAKKLLKYENKLIFPVDFVGTEKNKLKKYDFDNMPKEFIGFDVGPKSISLFKKELKKAKTILWNGPLGMFEKKPFDKATTSVAKFLSKQKVKTIVGGGDTAAAVKGVKLYHISTGGGASLEFIEKSTLPALKWVKK